MKLNIKLSRLVLLAVFLQAVSAEDLMAHCCLDADASPASQCSDSHVAKDGSIPVIIPPRSRLNKISAEGPEMDAVSVRTGTDVLFPARDDAPLSVRFQSFPSPVHFLVLRI